MESEGGVGCGGILGRFENVRSRKSCKRIVTCESGTAEYLRADYLKPQHLPAERVDAEANYTAGSRLNETRFHKGFHRRNYTDIQQDSGRLENERVREQLKDDKALRSVAAAREHKDRHTFNILTGEGVGREAEFKQIGKKVLNPSGSMAAVFDEHPRQANSRLKGSKHRFFEAEPAPRHDRTSNIFNEGLVHTKRENAILGYGNHGRSRTRVQSCGVSDNYAHLSGLPPGPQYEAPLNLNRSQIVLG